MNLNLQPKLLPAKRVCPLPLAISGVLWLCGAVLWDALAQNRPLTEYQLKAAFIYNFAKFVEWPPEAFPSASSPLIIGIVGDNPFQDNLEQVVENKSINGHKFQVKRFKSLADVRSCHILFVSATERKRLAEILRAVRGAPVLTTSDLDYFLSAGGMIQFLMEGNKVRFAINDSTAKEAGLRISSKLLNLARSAPGESPR